METEKKERYGNMKFLLIVIVGMLILPMVSATLEDDLYGGSLYDGDTIDNWSTSLTFEVRSCAVSDCDGISWIGNFTNSSFSNLSSVSDNRYFQYKAIFESDLAGYSPLLSNVSVGYEILNATFASVKELEFDDFNFSNSVFEDFATIQINLTENTTLINDFVFNFEKISGSGDSDIYLRSVINGVPKASSVLTTISGNENNKEVVKVSNSGILPVGVNNLTYQIYRTGTGTIEATNVRKVFVKTKATNGLDLDYFKNSINGSCVGASSFTACSSANYSSRFNQFLISFNTGRISDNGDIFHLKINNSPVSTLDVEDSSDFASASHNWIFSVSDSNSSFPIEQYSEDSSNFDITGNVIFLGLSTNESVSIPYFNKTGTSSHTSTIGYGIGTREVLNASFIVTSSNNDYYISFNGHLQNNIGVVGTSSWVMSVDGTECRETGEVTHSNDNVESIALVGVCENLSSGEHVVRVNLTTTSSSSWSYYDDVIVGIEGREFDITEIPDTTNPVVNWTFPDYPDWTNLTINGTCSDDSVLSFVSIDNALFTSTGSSFEEWEFTYIGGVSLNSTNLTVTCGDIFGNNGSASQVLGADIVIPTCSGISDQDVISGENYSWNITCVDDLNLYSLNVSCSGGSSFSFYKENINDVSYLFNNNTGNLTSSMVCDWEVTDAHTMKDISDKLNSVNTFYYDNKLVIDGFTYIEFDDSDSDNIDSLDLDFTSKKDRVKFKVTPSETKNKDIGIKGDIFDIKKLKENKLTFYVNAKNNLDYVDNDLFPAWFVIDNYYWVDFDVLNGYDLDYKVQKINDKRYRVIIKGKVEEYFDFNSLGIVNTNYYHQTFSVSLPSLNFGVVCGESYVNKNISLNFSSNNLHDCSLRVNGLVVEDSFNCSEYEFEGFVGRNYFQLSGLDVENQTQSGVCSIYINPVNKSFSDLINLFIWLGVVIVCLFVGGHNLMFDVLGLLFSIPLSLEMMALFGGLSLIIPALVFLILILRKRRNG